MVIAILSNNGERMKRNNILGLLLITVAMVGCSGEPGPYDGSWSYSSDKTNEFSDAGFMRGLIDAAGNMRYKNLKIKNNKYTLELWGMPLNCKIGDSSIGNCAMPDDSDGGEGALFSLVGDSLHITTDDDSPQTYVLDKN